MRANKGLSIDGGLAMGTQVPIIGAEGTTGTEGDPRVDPQHVRRELGSIRDALAPIMSAPDTGGLSLSEVSVELGITASGEVGFIFAKTEIELAASITLTFGRPKHS